MPHITRTRHHPRRGGPGSRLLPHTAHAPEMPDTDRRPADPAYQIAALRACGIDRLVIVVGYLPRLHPRVRRRVGARYVENRDYASTNSSYSLWLAREHMRDGFIHLNSDLLFEPRMLRALLDVAARERRHRDSAACTPGAT